jgi:hypothetical protein
VRSPFKFNCIHDLESTWWIALWVLFHHTPRDDKEDRSAQIARATRLFPPTGSSNDRITAFVLGILEFEVLHPAFQRLAEYLITARRLLVERYQKAEKESSIDATAFVGLHEKLRAIWQNALEASEGIQYQFVAPPRNRDEDRNSEERIPKKRRTGGS